MVFDFNNSIYKPVIFWSKILPPWLQKTVLTLLVALGVAFLTFFLFPKIHLAPIELQPHHNFALFIFFSDLTVIFLLFILFLKTSLEQPLLDRKSENLADYLDLLGSLTLDKALRFAKTHQISLEPSLLIYFFLFDKFIEFIFERLTLDKINFQRNFELIIQSLPAVASAKAGLPYSSDFISGLEKAQIFARDENHERIMDGDLFLGMVQMDKNFQRLLSEVRLEIEDFKNVVAWEEFIYREKQRKKQFWRLDNLLRKKGVGKDWAFGYTPTLDKFSTDMTKIISRQGFDLHLIARKNEVEQIENILSRAGENNCLVVGSVGIGKKTTVLGFTKLINEGKSTPALNYKRVVWLDNNAILAGLTQEGEIITRFKQILNEALRAGNVILVIDEIHNLFQPSIASIFEPYMASANFQLIGITNYAGLHQNIKKQPALLNLFEKVEILEPTSNKTIIILQDLTRIIEQNYKNKIKITYPALKEIVNLSERYITNISFPQKAIHLLEEVVAAVIQKGGKFILAEHVKDILSKKLSIPIGEIKIEEKEKLLNLENLLHQRIINQEEAVKVISEAMRRARAGISAKKKPFGTFLFLGPTGVGKTETAKALSQIYFGSEENIVRLDMSEFQESHSLERIIGPEENQFAQRIKENPYSVVLLDEIEKAHKNILNLFLQVLDEGYFSDVAGQKVSFLNTIIIATSNAGAEFIRQAILKSIDPNKIKSELIEYLFKQDIFRPEFLNRFDAVVIFHPLSLDNIKIIAKLMLTKLNRNLSKTRGLEIEITSNLVNKLAEIGFDPVFGARAMQRVIQEKIEAIIAKDIIEGKYKPGALIQLDVDKL